ncbi:MAG: hypothetical protein K2O89_00350 [Clostridia bacterium]|nr:hypothetical protein [Clostridia bacterium]
MKSKKWLALLMSAAMIVPVALAGCNPDSGEGEGEGGTPPIEEEVPIEDTSTKLTGKIYLVGDSTVCDFVATQGGDNYYLPRYGYGTQLYNYINSDPSQIVNLALSGRSTITFYSESNYSTLKNNINAGDYLIIGFGHNDEKSGTATFASANESTTTEGSFKYNLNEYYIKLATEKGATPILCTPIVRYDSSNSYSGDKVHATSYGDYKQAIIDLGQETDTTVLDLTSLTKAVYQADNAAAANYHAHTTYSLDTDGTTKKPDGLDATHINMYGAKMVCYQLSQALLNTGCTLKNSVKTNIAAPTYENDFAEAVKIDYVKPNYVAFDESNTPAKKLTTTTQNDTTANWYSTVMGEVGGASKLDTITINYADSKFTVSNNSNNGKFAATQDGFGAAFTQISSDSNFIVSAKAKIVSKGTSANNQSAFGIMLRDDIYVNEYSASLRSRFVSASALGDGSAMFLSRTSETAITTKSGTVSVVQGAQYEMSLERNGQIITATLKTLNAQGAVTATYTEIYTDYAFKSVDFDNMYVCMFANRGLVVEFSELSFEVTGTFAGE